MPHDRVALPVAFVRVLRQSGVDVPVGASVVFAQALAHMGVGARDAVYWSGRATLLRRPEDIPIYDAAFATFWERVFATGVEIIEETPSATLAIDDDVNEEGADADEESVDRDDETVAVRWSAIEVLRHRDFAEYSEEEFEEARMLLAQLKLRTPTQPARRYHATRSSRQARLDVHRTVRNALATGGEPIRRTYRVRGERHRRLVMLLDVSGSMEPYARAFVRFVHASMLSSRNVEAFAMGTRLTRMTRELQARDPDAAIAAAARRVVDWSGGTRLGEGLREFNDLWGVRGFARGAIVVVLSDGWDRGNPEVLGEQMQRLHRVAHRMIWVNPLKASEGYAPLARGMAAALAHVDSFVEGHSIDALTTLARAIGEEMQA